MTILAIESSGLVASAAILCNGCLVGEFTTNFKKTHSQTLLPMLDQVIRMLGIEMDSVDAIAVSKGPGSFTGLRIGSATAKGLGLALNRPLIAVPTVDAIAYNLYGNTQLICPLMDARRSQVYTGLYTFKGDQFKVVVPQKAVSIQDILAEVNSIGEPVIFLGDGVPVYQEAITAGCQVAYSFAPAHVRYQRAGALAALAWQYYERGEVVTAAEYKPDYLRLSQAERELAEKNAPDGKAVQ